MKTNPLLNQKAHFIRRSLLDWYANHARPLPWRSTRDPYRIWLSEIILQQTRVAQGLPYYERFVETYPRIEDLADAPQEDVMRLWQGLGYYSRARNLHACAKEIMTRHEGKFPASYEALLTLPGIGRYTAAAIASFAFKQAVPVVDGNVYRLLARLLGIYTDIQSSRAFKEFFSAALELIDPKQPDDFNQALMEFGALQCKPQNPLCDSCPLQAACYAYAQKAQALLPVKEKKTKVRKRYLHYLAIRTLDGRWLMRQRPAGDIWQALFDFHWIETEHARDFSELADPLLDNLLRDGVLVEESRAAYTHLLSHQRLQVDITQLSLPAPALSSWLSNHPNYGLFTDAEAEDLPKPILIENYLKTD